MRPAHSTIVNRAYTWTGTALAQPSQALPTIESRLHLGAVAHAKLRVCLGSAAPD